MNNIRKHRQHNITLIADDDLYIRQLVRRGLSGLTEVVETGNGGDVIDLYKRVQPDILLLDIHMPQANGPDLIPSLMAFDPDAYIIMLSADAIRDNIMHCINLGAKGFIAKPFSKTTLLRDFYRCPTVTLSDHAALGL